MSRKRQFVFVLLCLLAWNSFSSHALSLENTLLVITSGIVDQLETLQTVEGAGGTIQEAAFDATSKLIAIASWDGLLLWDTEKQLVRWRLPLRLAAQVSFSPDGKLLVAAAYPSLYMWDNINESGSWSELKNSDEESIGNVGDIQFSDDGTEIIAVLNQNRGINSMPTVISVANVAQMQEQRVLQANAPWANDLEFSPDGTRLAVAETASPYDDFEGTQGKVRVWNTVTWEEAMVLSTEGLSAMTIAFNRDGQWLAVGNTTGEIQIWNPNSQRVEATLSGHTTWVNALAFDPGGSLLVSGSGYLFGSRGDYTVRLWLTGQWEQFYVLTPENAEWGAGLSVAFNPIGTIIAAGMTNGTVHLWDGELKDEIAVLDGYAWAHELIFTPDSSQILFSAKDGVRVWNVESAIDTFGNIPEYTLVAPLEEGEFIFSIALSPDGKVLAVGYQDGSVRLWNMDNGEQLTELKGHEGRVVSLSFSPDGTLLASGGTDGTVRLWGVADK